MSRYIVIPKQEGEHTARDVFHLIPTEGIIEQIKDIELPEGIIPNITENRQVHSEKEFNNLLLKFSKANIGRSKDGFITIGSKVSDIKFDDFAVDCCNGVFKEEYENVYCILRNYGITF